LKANFSFVQKQRFLDYHEIQYTIRNFGIQRKNRLHFFQKRISAVKKSLF